jgi:Zn-dependent protease
LNDFSLEILLGRLIGLVIGFTLHEYAHAATAYRLGDNTAYFQGRVTLDPRAHIEPIGIVLALIAGFGWARPVPVNPRAFYPNEKRGMVVVALAGPVMNLAIAMGFGLLIRLLMLVGLFESETWRFVGIGAQTVGTGSSGVFTVLYHILGTIVLFNLVMFLFNLLPFAPLDGYKIAVGSLPYEYSNWLIKYERETTFALMLLLLAGAMSQGRLNVLWAVLGPPLRLLYELFTSFYPYLGA